jgi:hypothetical protein
VTLVSGVSPSAMSDPLAPIRAQKDDYAALLDATRALLAGSLDERTVTAFRAEREAVLTRTARREERVVAALQGSADAALAAEYRGVLEDLAGAERELSRQAARERDTLGRELAHMVHGRRALSGYRSPGPGTPRAVSRHI